MKIDIRDRDLGILKELLDTIMENGNDGDFSAKHIRVAARMADQIEDYQDESEEPKQRVDQQPVKKW